MVSAKLKKDADFQAIVSLGRVYRRRLRKLREALSKPRWHRLEIPIDECVHFSAIRFGTDHPHPFERYLLNLKNGVPLVVARRRFVEFLLYYRPRDMGEAQGLSDLSRQYPLWLYPWQRISARLVSSMEKGWCATPNSCPDVMTHFCELGIQSFRIDEQFYWLERAFHAMSENGYQPEQHGDYINVRQFCRLDGKCAYLLLDGNHRVAAMSVLGYKTVQIERKSTDIVFEKDCDQWYGVQQGFYTREDALKLFHVYFEGNQNYRTTDRPAKIVGPRGWLELHGL